MVIGDRFAWEHLPYLGDLGEKTVDILLPAKRLLVEGYWP